VSDPNVTPDPALSAANYTPPNPVAANTDIAALIEQAVAAALQQREAEVIAASQPVVLTPEEQARVHLDNSGAGLGVEERLAQVYALLHLIAQKVGI
jgi:hypothetical protein